MKVLYLYFVLGLSFAFASESNSKDTCKTPSGQQGKCVPIQECPQLTNTQKDSSAEVPLGHQCEQSGAERTYCCPVLPDQPKCGSALNTRFPEDEGNSTEVFQYPWMALIAYNTTKRPFRCAGTIISSRYILTAASCYPPNFHPIYVRLGEHNLDTEKDCKGDLCAPPTQDIPIEKIIVHPSYNMEKKYNDIALLRLQKDADLSSHAVSPICLPFRSSVEDYEGKRFLVTSWVKFRVGQSPVLLKNIVRGVSHEKCSELFRGQITISPSQLCAHAENGDNCIGNSGSPLVTYVAMKDETVAVQYGIVSFGAAVCDNNIHPLVYTNVSSFKDWILEVMG